MCEMFDLHKDFHSPLLDLVQSLWLQQSAKTLIQPDWTFFPSRLILLQALEWLKWNVDPSFLSPLPNLVLFIHGTQDSVFLIAENQFVNLKL